MSFSKGLKTVAFTAIASSLGPIGTHISNHASFDQRNYGFKKLSDLFMAIDLFEMKKTNGTVIWVRDKKRAKQLKKPTQPHGNTSGD